MSRDNYRPTSLLYSSRVTLKNGASGPGPVRAHDGSGELVPGPSGTCIQPSGRTGKCALSSRAFHWVTFRRCVDSLAGVPARACVADSGRHASVGPSAACWRRLSRGWSPQLAARTRVGGFLVPPAVTVAGADAGRAPPRGARFADCQEVNWCVGLCVGAPSASPVAARSKQYRSCDFFASAATWLWPAWLVISFDSRAPVAVGDGARRGASSSRRPLLATAHLAGASSSRRRLSQLSVA